MSDSYADMLSALLGGIGPSPAQHGQLDGVSNDTSVGAYAGIERSTTAPFRNWQPTRITITAEEIANSQQQQGAFIRAMQEEQLRNMQGWRQDFIRNMYNASGFWDLPKALDPDMEMDIGL